MINQALYRWLDDMMRALIIHLVEIVILLDQAIGLTLPNLILGDPLGNRYLMVVSLVSI